MTARRSLAAAAVAVVLTGAGCGEEPGIVPAAARTLEARLEDLRAAVEAADRRAAERALDRLIVAAERWAERGRIGESRLREILAAAGDVADDLGVLPVPAASEPVSGADAPAEADDLDEPAGDRDTGPPPHAEAHGRDEDDDEKDEKGKDEDD